MENTPTTEPNTSFNFQDGELKIDWDKRQFQFQPTTNQPPKSARRYSQSGRYHDPTTRSLPGTPQKYAHPLVTATEMDKWTKDLVSEKSRRRNERAIHRSVPALKEFHLRLREAPPPRPVKRKLKKWRSTPSNRRNKKKPSSARSAPRTRRKKKRPSSARSISRIKSFTARLPRTAIVSQRMRRRRSYTLSRRNQPSKKSSKSKILLKRRHIMKTNTKGLVKSKRKLKHERQCIAPQMLDWMDQLLEKRKKSFSQPKKLKPKLRILKSTSALLSKENAFSQPKTWGGNQGTEGRLRRESSVRSAAGLERRTPRKRKSNRLRRSKSPWNYNTKNYGSRPSRVLTPRQPNLLRDHENPKNYWNPATGTSIARVEEKIAQPASLVLGLDVKQSIAGNVLKLQRENRDLKTQLTQLKKDAERASADELLTRLNKQMKYLTRKLNER